MRTLLIAGLLAGATPAVAGEPVYKVEDTPDVYKVEVKDRRCEFKYELKRDSGEEKVEEKGDCRHVVVRRRPTPAVVLLPR